MSTNHRTGSPTRVDVARRAGVSPAVVSYVLNDSNYVSDRTRTRVESAIRELGYRPNRIARGLKTKATQHILFVGNDIRNSFFAWLAYEMEVYARAKGYSLALSHAPKEGSDLLSTVSGFYDGLVVFSDRVPIEQINQVAAAGIPTVFAGNRVYSDIDTAVIKVDIGVVEGMKAIVHHLVRSGHRRIALFPGATVRSTSSDNFRMIGFRRGLEEAGIPYIDDFVQVLGDEEDRDIEGRCRALVDRDDPPTALICGNDSIAMRAIRALYEMGVTVPDRLAVVGFGNFPDSATFIPSITSVGISVELLAKRVVDEIVKRIEGAPSERIVLERTLFVRESG